MEILAGAGPSPDGAGASTLEGVERAHILQTLEASGWVVEGPRGAATALGLHPNTLRSRMKKLGISRPPGIAPRGVASAFRGDRQPGAP